VNFLGVRTRDEFTAGMPGVRSAQRRWTTTEVPAVNEEYFEWIDVLEAVEAAHDQFTMVELGAGYGRWLMNAAAAVRARSGMSLRLVGVEAEPTHFGWMRRHFEDNDVPETAVTLIHAAVAAGPSRVRFHIGDPSAWYGQAIYPNQWIPAPRSSISRWLHRLAGAPREQHRVVEVAAVTLSSVLQPYDRVDLVDLDIQGAEADVLESARAGLTDKVRRVHVGTHGPDIERRLRKLFGALGWINLNDYAWASEASTPWGRVRFEDGVQTWLNPHLTTF
jgi:FkbM family methyltransferase